MTTETAEPTAKRQKFSKSYIYPNQQRTISVFSVASKHPLNVKPSGNSYFSSDPKLLQQRLDSLGSFKVLPDELIMEIINQVNDIQSLLNLSHVSKVFYAFLYDEEIWKKIYVENIEYYDEKSWLGSWRNTILNIQNDENVIQLQDNLLCSDLLYRPFQCSQINYAKLFSKIIQEEEIYHRDALLGQLGSIPAGRIQRFQESDMTLDQFNANYHDVPFILVNPDTNRWPKWTFASLLERFPHVKFRQEAVSWDLEKYSQYLEKNKDENPLYLFDCSSDAMKILRKEYEVPQIFQEDLFKVFNNGDKFNCRPNYAWIIMGSARSGSTFHKDPNSTSAWNVAIKGRKLWVMLPPHVTPPGVGTDEDESEVTSPVSVAEWVISGFFNDSTKIEECQIGITFPGETMHVPTGWWHTVINIDDSIAITQNFVPVSKLPEVLNFLKNKPTQISGFRLKEIKQCLDYIMKENTNDAVLMNYSDSFDGLTIDLDEDCGELHNLPTMPIFEIFKQLLINNGKQELLTKSLERLEKIELKNHERETGKSKAWEKLTEESTTNKTFSFNFAESDDDDDNE
ncbi:JMJ22 Arginine-specific demethylase JMJ22 [Candida maltosa Xu316]|uniref:JmjC domain-containing protein n=1 Tax=Candida maltosa (strain Xu316) TaxID=1245528 RepID=M3K1L7_CANMX|nr:hypothetical protein G210_0821 [Candida maltosa Xu316]